VFDSGRLGTAESMAVKTYDWLAYHAEQPPDHIASIDLHSSRRLTYSEMNARTTRLADSLRNRFGVEKGDRVAMLANNTTDCMEVEFACLKLGAGYAPGYRATAGPSHSSDPC